MNTDTGRIYEPDEYARRRLATEHRERLDDHQAEFEAAQAAGKIVPVSAHSAEDAKWRSIEEGDEIDAISSFRGYGAVRRAETRDRPSPAATQEPTS